MSKKQTVRVGADPEIFVKSTDLKEIVPIVGLVGGSKEQPIIFQGLEKDKGIPGNYAYQEDGCAFEFNIPAGHNYEHTAGYLSTAWLESKKLLGSKHLIPVIEPFVEFKPDQLTDPRTRLIGCSADMDAYAKDDGPAQRPPLDISSFGNTRFAGGHLHLSYDKSKVPPHVMAQFMDVLVALPTLHHDKQGVRRKYYGVPGLYREKPYGIEYRTLSNFWLKWVDDWKNGSRNLMYLMASVFDLGIVANTKPQVLSEAYKLVPWADVKDCITQENVNLAYEIWKYVDNTAKIPTRYGKSLWA